MTGATGGDLTPQEQQCVRAALRFLHARCGSWEQLAKLLHVTKHTVRHVATDKAVTASLAVRVARLVRVGIDDLLIGKFPPPGACAHCGHVRTAEDPTPILGDSIAEGGAATPR